jgi:RNA polymerase sigma factor (sigma-70 family)
MENDAHDDGVAAFVGARRRLFGIAYRMLGSAADAEDILQDVWLRWQAADRRAVSNPAAFLATTTLRLVINLAQSARSRRELCVGFGLPEPMHSLDDPGFRAERGQALELALRLLLESLSPKERAAYILREAFGYLFPEIAEVLRLTEANTRQLISRARKRIGARRRTPASADEHRRLLEAFIAAAQTGDFARLEGMFGSARQARTTFGLVVGSFWREGARSGLCSDDQSVRMHSCGGPASPGVPTPASIASHAGGTTNVQSGAASPYQPGTPGPGWIDSSRRQSPVSSVNCTATSARVPSS